MTQPSDGHLGFGLLLMPTRITAPIHAQLGGRRFTELRTSEAAAVLEGVALLQWLRAGAVGAAVVLFAYLTRDWLSVDSALTAGVIFTLLLWLPTYMGVLGLCWLALRRSAHSSDPVTSAHPRILNAVRWAPCLALLAVGTLALVLA